MSDGVLSYRGTVYPWQCDQVCHARKATPFPANIRSKIMEFA